MAKSKRVYFTHYGYIWSYKLSDAILMAERAVKDGCSHGHDGIPCKELKSKATSEDAVTTDFGIILRLTDRFSHMHDCLDWESEDWSECLKNLKEGLNHD